MESQEPKSRYGELGTRALAVNRLAVGLNSTPRCFPGDIDAGVVRFVQPVLE